MCRFAPKGKRIRCRERGSFPTLLAGGKLIEQSDRTSKQRLPRTFAYEHRRLGGPVQDAAPWPRICHGQHIRPPAAIHVAGNTHEFRVIAFRGLARDAMWKPASTTLLGGLGLRPGQLEGMPECQFLLQPSLLLL